MPRTAWLTVAFVLALLGGASNAGAVNRSWVGGSGDWNVAGNWNPSGVPGSTDTAFTGNDDKVLITLKEFPATVAQITGGAELAIDGVGLTITGTTAASSLIKATAFNGGAISVTGPTTLLLGQVTLGKAGSTGSMAVSAATTLSGSVTEAAAGLGSFTIAPATTVDVPTLSMLSITASMTNRGTLQTEGTTSLVASDGAVLGDGEFVTAADATLNLAPPAGSTFTLAGAVTGAGHVELVPAAGIVSVPAAGGTFAPGSLRIDGTARLDLNRNAEVGALDVRDSTGSSGRLGSGVLTVSGLGGGSALVGGRLSGRARPSSTDRC